MRDAESTAWLELQPGAFIARLPGGEFRFQMNRIEIPFTEICDVAIRNNPRRRFLFVSRVLGRHCPVRPGTLRDIAMRLAAKVADRGFGGPAVFVGMAETATTLAQAVFREWRRMGRDGLYIESTRRQTGGEVAFGFSESHSHASAHLLHRPGIEDDPEDWFRRARQVVIVDDEATTAATAVSLIRNLRAYRSDAPFSACLAVILRWQAPVGEQSEVDTVVSLAEGTFEFLPSGSFPPPAITQDTIGTFVPTRRGARHGVRDPESIPMQWDTTARRGDRILVLGNGEHGYRPLVFAEALEDNGAVTWIQATTRSPILPGGAVGHVRHFPALSGEAHEEYLYNVPDDHSYDRVILCTEDTAPRANHPIWRIPRLEVYA